MERTVVAGVETKRKSSPQKGPHRDPEKENFWRQRISEAVDSGLSVREFCKDYGLNENLFYSWRRELKQRDVENQQKPGFVELITSVSGNVLSGVSMQVGERVSIVVERGFDVETLKSVLGAVTEVCAG